MANKKYDLILVSLSEEQIEKAKEAEWSAKTDHPRARLRTIRSAVWYGEAVLEVLSGLEPNLPRAIRAGVTIGELRQS